MRQSRLTALIIAVATAQGWPTSSAQENGQGHVAFDNAYVRVVRDAVRCATAVPGRCEDRVILAMGDIEVVAGGAVRSLKRGEVALFKAGESYDAPRGAAYYEITIKPDHPPVKAAPESIAATNNAPVFDGPNFFIYEERLPVGATRPRHSHSQRIEIRVNQGPQLRQKVWRDGEIANTEPAVVNWREPIVHEVTNVGDMPLHNFILEFKPGASASR